MTRLNKDWPEKGHIIFDCIGIVDRARYFPCTYWLRPNIDENLYFLKKIFFVFLCFEGNFCGEGTLCPPKANRVNTKD